MSEFVSKIDENLYSRQIAVYGKNAMKSLTQAKINIIGFDGSCLELCKNLILAGVGEINLTTDKLVQIDDLSTNYYATENDIGEKVTNVIKGKLSELNPYVIFTVNYDLNVDNYDLVVLINNHDKAIEFNKLCRNNNTKFIWMNTLGLMANTFCDFGNFISKDIDGENVNISVLQNITSDAKFTCIDTNPHGLYKGDIFKVEDVKGINNINNKIFTVKNVIDNLTFEIEEYDANWKDYSKGGRIIQVKKEFNFEFTSLEQQLSKPQFVNLDYVEPLHKLFLKKFSFPTDEQDWEYNKIFNNTCNGQFMPVCSIIGSYVAQEVVKGLTNKYTPTNQWYYYHCYDILPSGFNPTDNQPVGDRYDGMRLIFGEEYLNKIRSSSFFVVGSGAIGCEHLKNFSMVGIGSKESQIIITDMDTIEKSNLNRQFLFRNSDIGQIKSDVAAREAMKINPDVKIISHQNKVCPETEPIYNSDFFNSINGIANALDNVKARLYVDQRCIFNKKPLFESGTLGTKGNTQVIIPNVTEYYGESQDPQEKSFPVCTLKNFPNSIEHTIPWARNEFEELFNSYPNAWNKYLNDPNYLSSLTDNEKGEMISNIVYLWDNKCNSFDDCVRFAFDRFYEKYDHLIQQLLYAYPKDTETSSGINFWSGGKRCPVPINFNPLNELHTSYVSSTAFLIAEIFNVKHNGIINFEDINYKSNKFIPSDDVKITANDKEETENSKTRYVGLDESKLPSIIEMKQFNIKSIDFEKDDDTNNHIQFITCSSNLRASNYDIPFADFYETKIKAGKIIPAIATTTSMVSGLVTVEMIKYLFGKRKIEDYKNTFLNLALSMVAQSEPMPVNYNEVKEKKFSIWDYFEIKEDLKLCDLFNRLGKELDVEIDTLSIGSKLILAPMTSPLKKMKRMEMKISEILKEFKIELNKDVYEFQIGCLMEDEEYELPNVKFYFSGLKVDKKLNVNI